MIQTKLRQFFTDVVTKWNAGQKMALFMVLMSFEIMNYIAWLLYIRSSSYAQQFVNVNLVNDMLPWATTAVAVVLCCAYLFHRYQQNEKFIDIFQLVVMLIYTVAAAYIGYLVGQDNIMSAIAISTAGLLIIMFCKRVYAYWILALNLLCMFGVMYASKTGIFPPSDFYIGTRDSAFWVFSYLHLCGLKVLIILLLADNMLYVLQQSYQNSKFMSEHDTLTGLPNRLNTQSYLVEQIQSGNDVGLIMVDLDYFKQVNDNFGHLFGDKVLVEVADLLQSNLRVGDKVGRYGGEEFVVILPNTNMEVAEQVANLLHTTFNRLEINISDEKTLKPTASFGVVSSDYINHEVPHLTPEQMLKHLFEFADASMYFAKRNGRNQVVSAVELPDAYLQKKKRGHITQTNLKVVEL